MVTANETRRALLSCRAEWSVRRCPRITRALCASPETIGPTRDEEASGEASPNRLGCVAAHVAVTAREHHDSARI
jgi:hypothetical protein